MFNHYYLHELTEDIPEGLDFTQKKENASLKIRTLIKNRDKVCQICQKEEYLQIHHIIPNGKATNENLVTLCKYCHQTVHLILYVTKKWRYVDLLKPMPW